MTRSPSAHLFAVHERGLCAWDHDLVGRTLQSLDGVETDYFEAVAEILEELLHTQRGSVASIALRSNYRQGTEALMSLLGAAVQAPACVPTWIASCSTGDLRAVVAALSEGTPLLTTAGRRRVTFDELSQRIHRHAWAGEVEEPSTATRFGRFWLRLAADFNDDIPTAEYNALKHGLRVRPGGFQMSLGPERQQGERAHPESMLSFGGSPHGSTCSSSGVT